VTEGDELLPSGRDLREGDRGLVGFGAARGEEGLARLADLPRSASSTIPTVG
jgi:hypothetical protein